MVRSICIVVLRSDGCRFSNGILKGVMFCDEACHQGWINGQKMRELIERGDFWGGFFEELGI
jgi:hypothetical protein